MKVWYDTTRNLIQIDTVAAILPPLSVILDSEGDRIRLWTTNGSMQILNSHYSSIQDETGVNMTSLQQALDYLKPIVENPGAIEWDGEGLLSVFESSLI